MDKVLLIGKEAEKLKSPSGRYKGIYAYESFIAGLGPESKGKCEVIPEDLFAALDYVRANNRACIDLDRVCRIVLDGKKLSPLDEMSGKEYADLLSRKAVLMEMEKLYRYFMFAEKAAGHFNIKGKIDLVPGPFSYMVYRAMRQSGLLPENIEINRSCLLRTMLMEKLRISFNILRSLLLPETLLLKMKSSAESSAVPGDYDYGVFIHGGRGFSEREGGMDFFIDEKRIKGSDVLFVADEQPVPRINIRDAKAKGYNALNFHYDMVKEFDRSRFLKKYYPAASRLRKKIIGLSFRIPLLSSNWYHAFKDYILWELFNEKYHVKKFIAMQHPGKLTRVFRSREHGSENIFVHSAVVFDRLDRREEPEKGRAEQAYYSHLVYDKSVSDKSSNAWLATSQNDIKEYVNIGSIFSDVVFNVKRSKKEELMNKLGLPAGKKIISFFDGTVGHNGVLDFREALLLAEDMIKLLNTDETYYVLFKFKKPAGIRQFPEKSDVAAKFRELFANPRALCVNELDITALELMGISDLVVSTPLSSVVFESVIGGTKTIYYDPAGRYDQEHYLIENIPRFTAHGYDELARIVKYWLYDCSEDDFLEFQNSYIREYTDDKCDGKAIERFRDFLLTA